jgi:hypothetical protein
VQTDDAPTPQRLLTPSPVPSMSIGVGHRPPSHPSTPSPDPRSETSSFSDSPASNISQLLERVTGLLNKLQEADALTLTNRLKRHNLKGDVAHLSRTTVNTIISEASQLRNQFRHLLEDEKTVIVCTRKDLRALFKLFKELFNEMGQLRVTLNEIIMDPSIAPVVRELALDPVKKDRVAADLDLLHGSSGGGGGGGSGGWIGPISKLFGSQPPQSERAGLGAGIHRSSSTKTPGGGMRSQPKFVPKLQPALSASATTVNVEFSGSAVRSISSQQGPTPGLGGISRTNSAMSGSGAGGGLGTSTSGVMGIFAGAPVPRDSWVVLDHAGNPTSRASRRISLTSPESGPSGIGTPASGGPRSRAGSLIPRQPNPNRISRHVDAVIDVTSPQSAIPEDGEEEDYVAPLLQRTLRHRGLSDSSIHSTYLEQEQDPSASSSARPSYPVNEPYRPPAPVGLWPNRGGPLLGGGVGSGGGMFQGLARRVQHFAGLTTSVNAAMPSPLGEAVDDRNLMDDAYQQHQDQLVSPPNTGSPATSAKRERAGDDLHRIRPRRPSHPHSQGPASRVVSGNSASSAGSGGLSNLIPGLSSWATTAVSAADEPFYVGSPRDESGMLSPAERIREKTVFGHSTRDYY